MAEMLFYNINTSNSECHTGTLLSALDSRLTKRLTPDGRLGYQNAERFDVAPAEIASLAKLAELLNTATGNQALVRGRLRPDAVPAPEGGYYRLKREQKDGRLPTIEDAELPWAMIDFDGIPAPSGLDPLDPAAVGAHLASLLPEPFHGAGYVVQFSSTHQHVGNEGKLKAHLWFWLSRLLTSAEAKAWLSPWRKRTKDGITLGLIDCSLFDPIQLHYIAPPDLAEGVADPCPRGRVLLFDGPVVQVPEKIFVDAQVSRAETAPGKRSFTLNEDLEPPGGWNSEAAIEAGREYLIDVAAQLMCDAVEGEGNTTLVRVFRELRDRGIHHETALELFYDNSFLGLLPQHWTMADFERRRPDLGAYARADNIVPGTRHPDERVSRAAKKANSFVRLMLASGKSWDDAIRAAQGVCARVFEAPSEEPAPDGAAHDGESNTARNSKLLTPLQIRDQPPMRWRIEGMLPMTAVALCYGDSETFKSFLMLDLCLSMAFGLGTWAGGKVVPGRAVFLSNEGKGGVAKRIEAWLSEHGKTWDDLEETGCFRYAAEVPCFLLSDDDTHQLVADVVAFEPDVAVIDTLSQAMDGGKENDTADAAKFMKDVYRLRDLAGGAVILVHHLSHESLKRAAAGDIPRPRGAMDFWNKSDVAW